MPKLFISYSRVDAAFTQLFVQRLQCAFPDLTIWHDRAPHGLIRGGNWWNDVLTAIATSDVFIYILSNESVNSLYCQAEFTEARRLQKRIITVQARDKTELADDLDDIHFINMKDGVDSLEVFASLVAVLRLRLDEAKHFRHARPLWKSATPKPQKETLPARAADAPDVETPPLEKPTAEQEALRLVRGGVRWQIIGVVVSLILGLAALAAAQIMQVNAPTSPTSTPTLTPLQATLAAARSFTGANADWQARYPDGFVHSFDDGVPMVLVPPGCFRMGSTAGADHEQPVNEQCFAEPFWIDLTEVTQADFERLGGRKANANGFDGVRRPVEQITWFEARDFCALRGARLPTEREWEYAARGPDNFVYPWGNAWNENNAVWSGNSSDQTADVGTRPAGASWVGAFDLSGNVWEWTSSLYLPYDSTEDREADTGSRTDVDVRRVMRGGSWFNFRSDILRSAFRFGNYPALGFILYGFRCARAS